MKLRWIRRKIHSHAKDSCENLYPCVEIVYVLQAEVPVYKSASYGSFEWRDIPVCDAEGNPVEDLFVALDKNCQQDLNRICVKDAQNE